jgi:hypothetical protein
MPLSPFAVSCSAAKPLVRAVVPRLLHATQLPVSAVSSCAARLLCNELKSFLFKIKKANSRAGPLLQYGPEADRGVN